MLATVLLRLPSKSAMPRGLAKITYRAGGACFPQACRASIITCANWPPSGVVQLPASSAMTWLVLVSVTPPFSMRRRAMSSAI